MEDIPPLQRGMKGDLKISLPAGRQALAPLYKEGNRYGPWRFSGMNILKFYPGFFFTKAEKSRIVSAVQEAERGTSGEIRVHLERHVKGDLLEHAKQVFERIGMADTKDRNGVLIFLVLRDKQVAILGDKGIHEKVPADFWNEELALMQSFFRKGEFAEGISQAILRAGEKLKAFFPRQTDDKNELPDRISY
jgi:uncharacterized membrane protein